MVTLGNGQNDGVVTKNIYLKSDIILLLLFSKNCL